MTVGGEKLACLCHRDVTQEPAPVYTCVYCKQRACNGRACKWEQYIVLIIDRAEI